MKVLDLITFEADFGDGVTKSSVLKCDDVGNLTFVGDLHPSNAAQYLFDQLEELIKEHIGKNKKSI